ALHKALRTEALHKALREALRTEALHKALRTEALHEALRTEALHEAPHRVPAIFPIASTRASAKYTPYIHLGSHLIFYPSLHPPYLGRHQNDSQQTTVAGA